jgi:hypothetical protein
MIYTLTFSTSYRIPRKELRIRVAAEVVPTFRDSIAAAAEADAYSSGRLALDCKINKGFILITTGSVSWFHQTDVDRR